ncbi:MAG: DUF1634 domain-containing protein [Syntrophaceae bacterium]|nr:DUF1634 domain-containing protein [Syntrophaceae bacterium]
MENKPESQLTLQAEQFRYAGIMEKGMFFGLAVLIVTFILYVTGIIRPYIPLNEFSRHFHKDVNSYLAETNIDAGWGWIKMLQYGDFLNFIGIAILTSITILCYISIVPVFWKKKDWVFAILAILEVIVLLIAASGLSAY